ncbi:MAG: hypothetical protein AAFQ40_05080 [Cyanobacteria bacterium J06623_5]
MGKVSKKWLQEAIVKGLLLPDFSHKRSILHGGVGDEGGTWVDRLQEMDGFTKLQEVMGIED